MQQPSDPGYCPSALDRMVNRSVLLIVALLAAAFGYELYVTDAAQIEWLSLAVRLLAYDKPL